MLCLTLRVLILGLLMLAVLTSGFLNVPICNQMSESLLMKIFSIFHTNTQLQNFRFIDEYFNQDLNHSNIVYNMEHSKAHFQKAQKLSCNSIL